MRWKFVERFNEKVEVWLIEDKNFFGEVFIDKRKGVSEVEFYLFTFPRHIVEDCGWKKMDEAIRDLKRWIKELEKIRLRVKKLKLKVFSDGFIGFKTRIRVMSVEREEIEKVIGDIRKGLKI